MKQITDEAAEEAYKRFIDSFVQLAQSNVIADRIQENGHSERTNDADRPLSAQEAERKALFLSLSPTQRQCTADMLRDQKVGALHDLLCLMEWEVTQGDWEVATVGVPLGKSPFGSYHFDFICRSSGDDWPGSTS